MVPQQRTLPLDEIFFALSDPKRRSILQTLQKGPSSVSDLSSPFTDTISPPAFSRHLRVLETAGLIENERVGKGRVCRLRPLGLLEAARQVNEFEAFWRGRFDELREFLKSDPNDPNHA